MENLQTLGEYIYTKIRGVLWDWAEHGLIPNTFVLRWFITRDIGISRLLNSDRPNVWFSHQITTVYTVESWFSNCWIVNKFSLGTIHLRRWQFFYDFWSLPPNVGRFLISPITCVACERMELLKTEITVTQMVVIFLMSKFSMLRWYLLSILR